MDRVVKGWWTAMFQQGCNVSKELCFGSESSFSFLEGLKKISPKYVEYLTDHFLPWYRRKNYAFHNKIIFMHDNAPSHAAKQTSTSMAAK